MLDKKLIILLIVCVSFMVYLGVEGFAQYQSYTDRLAAKYGLGSKSGSMKTASDFASTSDYISASLWQAQNISGQTQNLYKMLSDGVTTRDDIRKLITDMSASGSNKPVDPKWLTYYDATDYSASNIERKTGSRWNETSYVDTVNYNKDASGGRHLIQCDSNDFACIRLLGYSDPNYQPYQGDQSWNAPAQPGSASAAPAPAPALANNPTVIDCITKCLNNYGGTITADRVKACATLCTTSA